MSGNVYHQHRDRALFVRLIASVDEVTDGNLSRHFGKEGNMYLRKNQGGEGRGGEGRGSDTDVLFSTFLL